MIVYIIMIIVLCMYRSVNILTTNIIIIIIIIIINVLFHISLLLTHIRRRHPIHLIGCRIYLLSDILLTVPWRLSKILSLLCFSLWLFYINLIEIRVSKVLVLLLGVIIHFDYVSDSKYIDF